MNYKIVSNNKELIKKASLVFLVLDMKESIHIQDVDFWLVDVNTMDKHALVSYSNKLHYTSILFVVNNDKERQYCLKNSFFNYIKVNFSQDELKYWCKCYIKKPNNKSIFLEEDIEIDFKEGSLKTKDKNITLSKQEMTFLKELSTSEFVNTKTLTYLLKLNSSSSVRTIVNRLRQKVNQEFIEQKRDYGYKLNIKKEKQKNNLNDSYIKELEEQNLLMQEIIDDSPTFIVTFIHKQLYCINKSFRQYLGKNIVYELWNDAKGDFLQLLELPYNNEQKQAKTKLFNKGKHQIKMYNFHNKKDCFFEVKTFYFETLDKHLMVFKENKVSF